MRRIVILGGLGMGLIVVETIADLASSGEDVDFCGFLNNRLTTRDNIRGHNVLGAFADWRSCLGDAVFISAYPRPGEARERLEILRELHIPRRRWTTIIHPRAQIARRAQIGVGVYIGPNVVIEPGVIVGDHACLRAGSYLSHDVRVGDFGFVGPTCCISGGARLGEGVYVGANSVCRDGISIGDYTVVSLGSVILENVQPHKLVRRNPADAVSHIT